jgi:hypothetical protein
MLASLPFQPINFQGEDPCSGGCGDMNFMQRVIDGDVFQFQVEANVCSDAEQLVENNSWADGFDDWVQLSDQYTTGTEGLISTGGSDTIQQGGFTPGVSYYVVVEMTSFDGGELDISIGATSGSVQTITGSGTQAFWITASSSTLRIESIEGIFVMGSISIYEAVTSEDIEVTILNLNNEIVADTGMTVVVFENYVTISIDWANLGLNLGYEITPLEYGCYKISVEHCIDEELISNVFNYSETDTCSVLLSACMDGENALGLYFGSMSLSVRLDGVLGYASFDYNRVRYRNTLGRVTNYFARGVKQEELRLEFVPAYLLDFIGALPAFNNFYINGVEYSVESDSITPNYDNDSPTAGSVTIEVAKRTQILNMAKCTAEEVSCGPPPNCWAWTTFEPIAWVDGNCIGLVN